jgi:sulfoxide reductase heme-binding subunit YedZ
MIGLFAFSYVALHFLAYLTFLAGFDLLTITEDLADRTYITVGFLALLGLVPLAITSTNGWRRRLGRRWQKLHRLVYPIVGLGLLHYFWLTKDGYAEGVLYLAIFAGLMFERLLSARLGSR